MNVLNVKHLSQLLNRNLYKVIPVHPALFSRTFPSEEGTTESSLKAVNNHLRKVGEAANVELGHFAPQAIRCSLKDLVPYDLVRPLRFTVYIDTLCVFDQITYVFLL